MGGKTKLRSRRCLGLISVLFSWSSAWRSKPPRGFLEGVVPGDLPAASFGKLQPGVCKCAYRLLCVTRSVYSMYIRKRLHRDHVCSWFGGRRSYLSPRFKSTSGVFQTPYRSLDQSRYRLDTRGQHSLLKSQFDKKKIFCRLKLSAS